MAVGLHIGRVGKCNGEFPSIKSPGPLITWSWKVKENILAAVSLLPQGLWTLNLARWLDTMRSFLP